MTIRPSSSLILGTLILALAAAPTFTARGQTPATMDSSSSNSAPAAPAAPATATPPETTTAPAAAPAAPAPPDNTATAAPTERPTTYTVVSHDSLWTIAHKFATTVVKLRKANHLKKGALLHPGQVLQIPPASDTTTK